MTVPKRFGVLRFFGTLLKVLAWIVLVLSVLGAIGVAVAGNMVANLMGSMATGDAGGLITAGGGIVGGLLLLIAGLFYFLVLYVSGESIHLQLAVEENTRLTAALLLKMHQEGQTESTSTYGGSAGFANEPYES